MNPIAATLLAAAAAAIAVIKKPVLNAVASRLEVQEPGDCEFFWRSPAKP